MNFRDKWITDENGERFVFTVEMQRQLSERGLPLEPASLDKLGQRPQQTAAKPSTSKSKSNSAASDFALPATIQIDPQTGKYIGRMKWYNAQKGYGFIVRGAGEEIFFHKSNTAGDPAELKEGQWILYDVEETRKGPEATDVEPYEGDSDLLLE